VPPPGSGSWQRNQAGAHSGSAAGGDAKDPYAIFVAGDSCCNASTVAPIYQTFISRYPPPSRIVAAPIEEVTSLLMPLLGLSFRVEQLRRDPCRSSSLVWRTSLGRKPGPSNSPESATSLLCHAFRAAVSVLDTNVARILEPSLACREGETALQDCFGRQQELAAQRRSGSGLTLLDWGSNLRGQKSSLY